MAMLKNCEIHFLRANPKRPNSRYDKANPSWEVQLRTTNVAQKKEWELAGLRVKLVTYPADHEQEGLPMLTEDGQRQWRTRLRKHSITKAGEPASPIEVVDGALAPLDPDTVANGSIGNIRIFQYNYVKDGKPSVANVFMGIQITKHIKRSARAYDDDFSAEEMEVVEEAVEMYDDEPEGKPTAPAAPAGAKVTKAPVSAPKLPDNNPEDAF